MCVCFLGIGIGHQHPGATSNDLDAIDADVTTEFDDNEDDNLNDSSNDNKDDDEDSEETDDDGGESDDEGDDEDTGFNDL